MRYFWIHQLYFITLHQINKQNHFRCDNKNGVVSHTQCRSKIDSKYPFTEAVDKATFSDCSITSKNYFVCPVGGSSRFQVREHAEMTEGTVQWPKNYRVVRASLFLQAYLHMRITIKLSYLS